MPAGNFPFPKEPRWFFGREWELGLRIQMFLNWCRRQRKVQNPLWVLQDGVKFEWIACDIDGKFCSCSTLTVNGDKMGSLSRSETSWECGGHRTIEWLGLEGIFKIIPLQPPLSSSKPKIAVFPDLQSSWSHSCYNVLESCPEEKTPHVRIVLVHKTSHCLQDKPL